MASLTVRKNIESLTPPELEALRAAYLQVQSIWDNRGYNYFASLHGIPNWYCNHHDRTIRTLQNLRLFLPWHRAYLLQHAHQIVKEILFHNLAPLIPTGNGAKIYMETLIRGLDHRSIWQSHRTLHGSSEIRNRAGPITLAHHDFVRIVDEVLVREHLEKRNRLLFMGIYAVGGRLIRPAHDAILRVILAKCLQVLSIPGVV